MQAKSGLIRTHTFRFNGAKERAERKEKLMSQIARAYREVPEADTRSAAVERAYAELAAVNDKLYREIPVRVEFTADDPYHSYEEMVREVDRTGVLKIFSGGDPPEFLTRVQNLKGRAVHDWYGHIGLGVDFSLEGEWEKWRGMSDHYSDETARLLFTEVIGQQCYAHEVGGFDSDEFTQRGIIAPDSWLEPVETYMRMYSKYY